ncbi:MAG: type II toxin-antitoxin system VapC family toxin [Thermoleophilaceae bacterium]
MTVLDTSAALDYLLADGVASQVQALLATAGPAAAPDLLVFEVLAVLRRDVARGELTEVRAAGALEDLGDLAVDLFATLPLRDRAFELRHNLTAADALFVALAEMLGEALATKDRGLASAARTHTDIEVLLLGPPEGDR